MSLALERTVGTASFGFLTILILNYFQSGSARRLFIIALSRDLAVVIALITVPDAIGFEKKNAKRIVNVWRK